MCSRSKVKSMISRETIQFFFFFQNYAPFLTYDFLIPYEASHSRVLAPVSGALVLYLVAFECNTSDWLIWFSQSDAVLHSNVQYLGEKDKECS